MAGRFEEVKGRLKVALGSLTGNKEMESEGKLDRRAGRAKEKISPSEEQGRCHHGHGGTQSRPSDRQRPGRRTRKKL